MTREASVLWQDYFWALIVGGTLLVIFPIRSLGFSKTRQRAFLAAVALVTFGYGIPAVLYVPGSTSLRIGMLVFLCIPGLLLIGMYFWVRRIFENTISDRKRSKQRSLDIASSAQAMSDFHLSLDKSYNFKWYIPDTGAIMCMDRLGTEMRFLSISSEGGQVSRQADVILPISDVISVELIEHRVSVIESSTVSRKKGTVGRAVVGELLFGGVGAIVGAASAKTTSKTLGTERQQYVSSELIFGLKDLTNPVLRFISNDHPEADKWLHRVRSAMARYRSNGKDDLQLADS